MTHRPLPAIAFALAVIGAAAAADLPPMPPMSNYHFGLLRKGPAWTAERTPATDSLQAGHMANIRRMAAEGVLLAAGPFLDGSELRGVFIFRADTVSHLRVLANRDPAIRAGRLVLDLFPWFAPAGIGEPYRRMSQRPAFRDSMVRLQLALLKRGPKWSEPSTPETQALQEGHVGRIFRGLASGQLATAGPFSDAGDLRGVLVFRTDSTSARRWALADPAVTAGVLEVEMYPWMSAYGTMPGDTLGGGK